MALVKYNNRSILNVTALNSLPSGDLNLITTNTISSGVSSSSFTSNIDSTYDTYIFKFINIHPATNASGFQFNASADGGSNYNVTKTTSLFYVHNNEGGSDTNLAYDTGEDIAQGTGYQNLMTAVGNGNDESMVGSLFLFSPSSTTFVKHFISLTNVYNPSDYVFQDYVGGYLNTTSAINAVDFKMSSGNIDSGVIKMYGLSKS